MTTLRAALLALIALSLLGPGAGRIAAQTQTETKIRLLAEALAARDRGDLSAAKTKLESLLDIAPSDGSVQRLLLEINNRLAEEREALRRSAESAEPADQTRTNGGAAAAQRPASAPERPALSTSDDAGIPVNLDEPSAAEPPPPKEAPAAAPVPADPYAEAVARVEAAAVALARAEAIRLERTATYINAQRELARLHARHQNYAAAVAVLDAALDGLTAPLKELKAERDLYERRDRESKVRKPARSPFSR